MNPWDETFETHPVFNSLSEFGPTLDAAVRMTDLDPNDHSRLERLRAVLTFTGKRVAALDPRLVQTGTLDQICICFRAANSELQTFLSDGVAARITSANSHLDSVLPSLAQLVVPQTSEEFAAAQEAAKEYRKLSANFRERLISTIDSTTGEVDHLRRLIDDISQRIAAERSQLLQIATEFQSQFSTAQEHRSREFQEAQGQRQATAQTFQEEIRIRLSEESAAVRTQLDELRSQHIARIQDFEKQHVADAKALLDQMTEKKTAVEKLVGVIGALGVSSGYQRTADAARIQMFIWHGITLAALVALSLVAYYTNREASTTAFSWYPVINRVLLLLTISVISAYAARQADKNHTVERRNRKTALELAALEPFLAALPAEQQQEFRLKIGERTFGQDEPSDSTTIDRSPATLLDLLNDEPTRKIIESLLDATNTRPTDGTSKTPA